MKKIFSLMSAMVVALAINAENYYIGGVNNQWPEPGSNPAYQLTGEGDVLTVSFESVMSTDGLKVFIGEGWSGNELGKPSDDAVLVPNGDAVVLAAGGGNLPLQLAEKHTLEGATITFNPTTLELTITGTDVDHSQEADTYQIVGVGGNWDTAEALQFEEVDGVLTVVIPELKGTFKIIQNRGWDHQWATNWETKGKLALNEPYVLGAKGEQGEPDNLALAKPFGTFVNAKLTLEIDEDVYTLTMVEGTYEFAVADWYFPGSMLGWNCNDATKFEPVAGEENTYEILLAEFGKDFKVVYGNWMVEFGAPKTEEKTYWVTNAPMELETPCANVYAEDDTVVLTDVIATIEVDYETVEVVLTIEVEDSAIENIAQQAGAEKVIENGKLVVIKNGIRYTAKGARL